MQRPARKKSAPARNAVRKKPKAVREKSKAASAKTGEPGWAAIRHLYEDRSVPLADVAKKAGMAWQKVSRHAAQSGWKMRTPPPAPDAPAGELTGAALMPSKLAARLKRLIAREIEAIEGENARTRDAAQKERDARRLGSLVRSLEKLNDIKAAKIKRDPKSGTDRCDGEAMRAELERRLARLAAGAGEESLSARPDGGGGGASAA